MAGTLESIGPNKAGITAAPATELNFNSIGSAPSAANDGLDSAGINTGALGTRAAGLTNAVIGTNDTTMVDVPGGTLENGNDNGANWI